MQLNFNKNGNGLIPAVIQDADSLQVLMVGFMNQEALEKTKSEGLVTFFSRTKNRLWTKGETSGNFLKVRSIHTDCDQDSLLIKAQPVGNTCHTGSFSCFGNKEEKSFLFSLETIIQDRMEKRIEGSYIDALLKKGINKVAQKVGEEAVEVVIEALREDENLFKEEAADLLFHLILLLQVKKVTIEDIESVLKVRHQRKQNILKKKK